MKSHLSMVCWLLVLAGAFTVFAEPPAIQWTRAITMSGYLPQMPTARSTLDGGFIMAGSVTRGSSYSQQDFGLVKLSANGDSVWAHFYGDTGLERFETMCRTSDGGFVLGGATQSWCEIPQLYVVRTDAQGQQLWTFRYGEHTGFSCESVTQTAEGGFLLGCNQSLLVKLSSTGGLEWTRSCAALGIFTITAVVPLSDGCFIAGDGYRAIRLNINGDPVWIRGVTSEAYEECHSAQQTSDGGFVLAGWMGIQPPLDTWYTSWHLEKLSASGDLEWSRDYMPDYASECYSVRQTADGGYILASAGPVGVLRVNSVGDSLWTLGTFAAYAEQAPDGGFIYSYCGENHFILTKTYPEVVQASPESGVPTRCTLDQNYPNPFNPMTQISFDLPRGGFTELQIFDLNGRLVSTLAHGMFEQGRHVQSWNAAGVASGTYIYRLRTSDYSLSRSMILLK